MERASLAPSPSSPGLSNTWLEVQSGSNPPATDPKTSCSEPQGVNSPSCAAMHTSLGCGLRSAWPGLGEASSYSESLSPHCTACELSNTIYGQCDLAEATLHTRVWASGYTKILQTLPALHGTALQVPAWYCCLQVTLLDSLQKRCGFMEHVAAAAGLSNVGVVWARAEDAGRDPLLRDAHTLVIARAVAELRLLAELCLPLAAPGGHWVAAKGPAPQASGGGRGGSLLSAWPLRCARPL